jgi:general secretion pathway protein N
MPPPGFERDYGRDLMPATRGKIRLGAICAVLALGCQATELRAVTSRDVDILSDDVVAPAVQVFRAQPLPKAGRDPALAAPAGNPLWSVPLSRLSVTRERPVFSASRRPPPQAVATPVVEAARPPASAAAPEPLNLTLVGAVVGESDAIAVFIDRANRDTVRMRAGDTRGGWQLRSIVGREATLKNGDRTEILVLLKPGATAEPAPVPAAAPASVAPGAMVYGNGFAPFVPRSAPKHGEPDGL